MSNSSNSVTGINQEFFSNFFKSFNEILEKIEAKKNIYNSTSFDKLNKSNQQEFLTNLADMQGKIWGMKKELELIEYQLSQLFKTGPLGSVQKTKDELLSLLGELNPNKKLWWIWRVSLMIKNKILLNLFYFTLIGCNCNVIIPKNNKNNTENYTDAETLNLDSSIAEVELDSNQHNYVNNGSNYVFGSCSISLPDEFRIIKDYFDDGEYYFISSKNNISFGISYYAVNFTFESSFYDEVSNFYQNVASDKNIFVKDSYYETLNDKKFIVYETIENKTNNYLVFLYTLKDDVAYSFSCGGIDLSQENIDICNRIFNSIVIY